MLLEFNSVLLCQPSSLKNLCKYFRRCIRQVSVNKFTLIFVALPRDPVNASANHVIFSSDKENVRRNKRVA